LDIYNFHNFKSFYSNFNISLHLGAVHKRRPHSGRLSSADILRTRGVL